MGLTVETRKIEELIPYARNPRRNDPEVDRMVGSIREFGFVLPILITPENDVIDGHLRLKAARALGMKEIPVLIETDMTEAQIKSFRLLANRSANWAEFDPDLLRDELKALQEAGYPLAMTGFTPAEIKRYLTKPISPEEADKAPPVPEEPVSRLGDVWECGEHVVVCGDSTAPDTFVELLQGELAELAWTDPPYNVDYANSAKDKMRGKARPIANDALGEAFPDFLQRAMARLVENTAGAFYIAMFSSELDTLARALEMAGATPAGTIIWAKNTFTIGRADYQRQFEPLIWGWTRGEQPPWSTSEVITDVWHADKPQRNALHPTMKPVELIIRSVTCHSGERGLVLDPFGGSGSTLIACEMTGRRARLVELSPAYVDVIVQRYLTLTEGTAKHRQTGTIVTADPKTWKPLKRR